jgi:uncharacterized protein YxeA
MNKKILNLILIIALVVILATAVTTYDKEETIDTFNGATPTNDVMDAITGATEGRDEGDDD